MKMSKNIILPLTFTSLIAWNPLYAGDSHLENESEDAAREVKQEYREAKHEGHEALKETKEKSKEAWGEVKEESKEAWSSIKDGSKKAWSNTKDAFNEGVVSGKLETALILNEHLNPFEIDFEMEGDKVILSGEVESEIEKELAENIAMGIEGINDVDNKIKVDVNAKTRNLDDKERREFSQFMSDVSTSASIKTELLTNDDVKGMDIDVDTFNDVVTLSGKVDSEAQKSLAENIAKKRNDVIRVVNELRVNS